jgi:hypothetical protein
MSNEIATEEIAVRTKKFRSDWIEIDANLLARLNAIDHVFHSRIKVDPNTDISIGVVYKKKFCIFFYLSGNGTPMEYNVTKVPFIVLVKSAETLQKAIDSIKKDIDEFVEKIAASQKILDQVKLSPLLQLGETKP